MKFVTEIDETSLKKLNDTFFYKIIGNLMEDTQDYCKSFIYVITFNENGQIIDEELTIRCQTFHTLNLLRKDDDIKKNVEMIEFLIKSMKELENIKIEELKLTGEDYEFDREGNYEVFFQWKEKTEFLFIIQFSKSTTPAFLLQAEDNYVLCNICEIISEKMKKMMEEKMKMHSKERVRMLTNGYQLNV